MCHKGYKWDVFVSHNRQQKPWVRELVKQWKHLGLKVFFDEDDIPPGKHVVAGIEEGLRSSRHVVFVITPAAAKSRWIAMELSCGIYEDPDSQKSRIIPLVLERTSSHKMRLSIQALNRIDLSTGFS